MGDAPQSPKLPGNTLWSSRLRASKSQGVFNIGSLASYFRFSTTHAPTREVLQLRFKQTLLNAEKLRPSENIRLTL